MFTIIGTVPEFTGSDFYLRADNEAQFNDWLQSNRIDTKINPESSIRVRGSFAAQCRPGDRVHYTIECWNRSDGRRIRGLSMRLF